MFVRIILALFLLSSSAQSRLLLRAQENTFNLLHSFSQEFKDKIVNTLLHLYKRIFGRKIEKVSKDSFDPFAE